MGRIQFTPEQRQVIEAGDCTALVSAAAGSGKTAVLVQRIIEKLTRKENPQDIDRLLVVTYTNAAAAEMRERIGKRLEECLAGEEYADNAHLHKQVLLLRSAPIMTIHGFCLSLLREFFYELDLDPAFRVAEEAELTLLRADVMEELLEARYEAGEELFLRLTECLGSGKTDEMLVKYIESLYKFAQSAPFPEKWLEKMAESLERMKNASGISEEEPCTAALEEHIRAILSDCEKMCDEALSLCLAAEGPYVYAQAIESDREFLLSLREKETYAKFSEAFQNLEFQALSRKKCEASEEKREQVKEIRAVYKEMLLKLKKDYFFADSARMAEDMAEMAPLMQTLAELCTEYGTRYAGAKAERGLVDFNDLEHFAVRLLLEETEEGLRPTETAKLIRARFDEIMVDECQDSNQIQDFLLWSISGEEEGRPNRFMVGDVKQSIYKFRMAKPELFMKKYEQYGESGPYRKIVLGRNFRSRAAVVDAVNDVFACLMRKEFGGIAYDDAARLYLGADYPGDRQEENFKERENYTAEFLLTELDGKEDDEKAADRVMREAMTVGARIKKLIAEQLPIYDGEETGENGEKIKKFHPVSYKDITVLFRAMSGYAEPFLEVFTELGIPAVAETRSGYFDAQEVAVVLNALRVIDNPRQDIPLVSVLRSEMAGLTEKELAAVRIVAKEKEAGYRLSFYEALRFFLEKAKEDTYKEIVFRDEEQERFRKCVQSAAEKLFLFEERFEKLRAAAVYAGVPEVLEELYRLTSYPDYVRVKPAGERRAENLSMLVVKAKKFEESSYSGIFDFIRYIDRLIKYDMDDGEARSAAGEDAVTLMSIHKSKGLEAPVVFVAGLSKQFNRTDIRAGVVLHPDLGIGMDFRDEVQRVKAPTLFKKIIAGRLNYEMLSEELRVLYVALTRAKEKLILSAAVTSEQDFLKSAEQKACEGQADYMALFSANSYLDFLKFPLKTCMERGSIRLTEVKRSGEQAEEAVWGREQEIMARRERFLKILSAELQTVYDEGLEKELKERAAYCYPYPICRGKMKLSVSELKKAAYQEEGQEELFPETEPEKTIPRFLQEEKKEPVSGSERGTLYHRVMECMDFCREYKDETAVSEELKRLIQAGLIRRDAEEFVSVKKILQFFMSALGARMQDAARRGVLKREQPFVIGLPYGEVYKEDGAGDNTDYVMIQGVIDACFEERGALVLVDYKTDSVRENVREVLTKRYRTQLNYYEQALRQITGKPVICRMIYAFASGEAFPVERGEE